jgi:predicted RNase H-like HicB family nuclease
MKFKVIITYDAEYKGYAVDVPELEGCMSQGKSFDEAMENTRDAIRNWLEVEKELGREIIISPERQYFIGEVLV